VLKTLLIVKVIHGHFGGQSTGILVGNATGILVEYPLDK
jgi:hypothetical protein